MNRTRHPLSLAPPQSSSPARLILDISRLAYVAWSRTPKSILRVEFSYAEHFMASNPDCLHFTVHDVLGRVRVVDDRSAKAFIRTISRYWEDGVGSTTAHWRVALHALWIHVAIILRPGGDLEQLITARRGCFDYIIPSRLHLERTTLIEKLKAGDLKLVVFVNDILPNVHPDYFTEADADLYHRRMENTARLADAIIVNSEARAEALRSRFGESLTAGALVVAPLAIEPPAKIEPPPCLPSSPTSSCWARSNPARTTS